MLLRVFRDSGEAAPSMRCRAGRFCHHMCRTDLASRGSERAAFAFIVSIWVATAVVGFAMGCLAAKPPLSGGRYAQVLEAARHTQELTAARHAHELRGEAALTVATIARLKSSSIGYISL